MIPSYLRYLEKLVTSSTDVPANHRRQLLRDMAFSSSLAYQGFKLSKLRHEARRKNWRYRATRLGRPPPTTLSLMRSLWQGLSFAPHTFGTNTGEHSFQERRPPGAATGRGNAAIILYDASMPTVRSLPYRQSPPSDPCSRLRRRCPSSDSTSISRRQTQCAGYSPYIGAGGPGGDPKGRKDREVEPRYLYMQETINAYAAEELAVWALPTLSMPLYHQPRRLTVQCRRKRNMT
jgi:hypothetical protein